METNYISVTEIAGDEVSQEQINRLCNRYYWAGNYCADKDVVEIACGTGQGLGYLQGIAKTLEAGDYSKDMLIIARRHYKNRIKLIQCDAQDMPFEENSKDVIILFEAIYYIPDVKKFIESACGILRPGGTVLIATANKDLYDFNPSPYSHKYFGVLELKQLFEAYGFETVFFGDTPVNKASFLQKTLRPIKTVAVKFNLIPKTMTMKKILKRLVFGKLVKMSPEIKADTALYVEPQKLRDDRKDQGYKVIYCAATLGENK